MAREMAMAEVKILSPGRCRLPRRKEDEEDDDGVDCDPEPGEVSFAAP